MMVSAGSDVQLPSTDPDTNHSDHQDELPGVLLDTMQLRSWRQDQDGLFLDHDELLNTSPSNSTTSFADYYDTLPLSLADMRPDQLLIVYIFPVIIVAGTVGNLASAMVLYRSRLRLTSVYFYLLVLSVADTTVLYSSGVKTWIRLVTGVEWMHASEESCRTLAFMTMFSLHLSAWLVVLTTADRFIAVWFPLRASTLCSQARARIAVLILIAVMILFDGHLFWTMDLHLITGADGSFKFCSASDAAAAFMAQPFEYLKFTSYCLVPFATILSLNVCIIVRLRWTAPALRNNRQTTVVTSYWSRTTPAGCCRQTLTTHRAAQTSPAGAQRVVLVDRTSSHSGPSCASSSHGSASGPSSHSCAEESQVNGFSGSCTHVRSVCGGVDSETAVVRRSTAASQTRVTSMLLVVSFTWLALTTPFTTSGFLFTVSDITQETADRLMPFKAVAFLLMYVNHAINFYLYCLTGRKFRHELVDALSAARRTLTNCFCSNSSLRLRTNTLFRTSTQRSLTGNSPRSNTLGTVAAIPPGAALLQSPSHHARNNTIELSSRVEFTSRLAGLRKSQV